MNKPGNIRVTNIEAIVPRQVPERGRSSASTGHPDAAIAEGQSGLNYVVRGGARCQGHQHKP